MTIFKADPSTGLSTFRLYLLRVLYAMAVLMLGIDVWTEIFTHQEAWDPLPAVAFSFWSAFTLLAMLGVLHRIKMIPLLLLQFSYKLVWLIIVAYPLWSMDELTSSPAEGLAKANFIGLVLDVVIIPWSYVLKNYVLVKKRTSGRRQS